MLFLLELLLKKKTERERLLEELEKAEKTGDTEKLLKVLDEYETLS